MTTVLGYVGCRGSFSGNINGATSETTYLNAQFGQSYTYIGQSDAGATFGPFTGNPNTSTSGTLNFDAPQTGFVVLGIKAGDRYSYYAYNFTTPTSSVPFSTAGTSLNAQGAPQELSHAVLYRGGSTVVPEPSTYALMAAGLAGLGLVARRRRA